MKRRFVKPGIFRTKVPLNIYEARKPEELGTQAKSGRYLRVFTGLTRKSDQGEVIRVQLCEDGYEGLLRVGEYLSDALVSEPFPAKRVFNRAEILKVIPDILSFLFEAMQTPNRYLWGGTNGPNFDCSGLVQAAFASQGIWLPRDSKDQAEFTKKNRVEIGRAAPGDLLFFSHKQEIDHVAVYLGKGFFIHSSGPSLGRDGIGIDRLMSAGGRVSANYCAPVFRRCHQVCSSWAPKKS